MKSFLIVVGFLSVALAAAHYQQTSAETEKQKESTRKEQINDSKIARCEIWIGMAEGELIESWGVPKSRNVTETEGGRHDQLVYVHENGSESVRRCGRQYLPKHAYVYIEDGAVTAIQR